MPTTLLFILSLALGAPPDATTPAPTSALHRLEAEKAALDAELQRRTAIAQGDPLVLAAQQRIGMSLLMNLRKGNPAIRGDIDRFLELEKSFARGFKDQDPNHYGKVIAEYKALEKKIGRAVETWAQQDHPEVQDASEELERALWQALVKRFPDYPAQSKRADVLEIKIAARKGELRRSPKGQAPSLASARRGFATKVYHDTRAPEVAAPQDGPLVRVAYRAPLGENAALVTPVAKPQRRKKKYTKRPAIIWIHGGFNWSIDTPWIAGPRDNDQSGAALIHSDLVVMHPALRGSNQNPGKAECLLGEVDDVIAAARYLAQRPDVDARRIYLGGHSTGATLALLVAEKSDVFAGVFALGPISSPQQYGPICDTPGLSDDEAYVRAPIEFMEHNKTPTWVIEGEYGNVTSLLALAEFAQSNVTFIEVPEGTHFDIIRPVSRVIVAELTHKAKRSKRKGTKKNRATLDITLEKIVARRDAASGPEL